MVTASERGHQAGARRNIGETVRLLSSFSLYPKVMPLVLSGKSIAQRLSLQQCGSNSLGISLYGPFVECCFVLRKNFPLWAVLQ